MADTQRLARLEGAYEHLATKADLKDMELRLTAEIAGQTRAMQPRPAGWPASS